MFFFRDSKLKLITQGKDIRLQIYICTVSQHFCVCLYKCTIHNVALSLRFFVVLHLIRCRCSFCFSSLCACVLLSISIAHGLYGHLHFYACKQTIGHRTAMDRINDTRMDGWITTTTPARMRILKPLSDLHLVCPIANFSGEHLVLCWSTAS